MPSIIITNILQSLALYLLLGKITMPVWWGLVILFIILFFGVRTHYNTSLEKDGADTVAFWYRARSVIFIIDIVSILVLYGYILLF